MDGEKEIDNDRTGASKKDAVPRDGVCRGLEFRLIFTRESRVYFLISSNGIGEYQPYYYLSANTTNYCLETLSFESRSSSFIRFDIIVL